MSALRNAALEYLGAGWRVFPCRRDKRPLVGGGFHAASADADVIRRWWTRWPTASIGAPVPASLAVVDLDVVHDGLSTLAGLQAVYGLLPVTLTCRTGSGGAHHYFLHPGGTLRQGAGLLGPGLDTRMPGKGFTILPPSPHPSGRCYAWIEPTARPAPMPPWLAALLRPPLPPVPGLPPIHAREAYVRAALEGELANVIGAPVGTRNTVLHLAAVKLGGLVGAGVVTELEVTAALLDAARASGYFSTDGERAARATVASGLDWGRRHPREVAR